ncbi:hypothetical protein GOODEAATRI_000435 [Goodea atripinnis]|uniref:Uncharacterized protein n=1 Tax=Goodea atripinnis TaxID=208336 RepID=A0ABV0PUK4_9TELE
MTSERQLQHTLFWNQLVQIPFSQVKLSKPVVECCRLFQGTRYLAQIRVRYKQSPWSEWSSSKSGVTLETGRARINSE